MRVAPMSTLAATSATSATASSTARDDSPALKEELARGASIKENMACKSVGKRTVKGWLTDLNVPRGIHFDGLFRALETVYGLMMPRAGRRPVVTRVSLEAVRGQLAALVKAIDATFE